MLKESLQFIVRPLISSNYLALSLTQFQKSWMRIPLPSSHWHIRLKSCPQRSQQPQLIQLLNAILRWKSLSPTSRCSCSSFLVALILCPLKFPVDIHPLAPLPMSTGGGQSSSVVSSGILLKQSASSHDRSNNVILFGLPKSSLFETKTAIDNVFTYLIGKNVKVVDAFRLDRRSEAGSAYPWPLLMKLDNCRDRRLLLSSCRKLKDYSVSRLFQREDLPPEAHTSRPKGQARKVSAEAMQMLIIHSLSFPIMQPSTVTATQPATELDATDKSVPQLSPLLLLLLSLLLSYMLQTSLYLQHDLSSFSHSFCTYICRG